MALTKGHNFALSTDRMVTRSVDDRPTGRQIFPAVMEAARRWWPNKVAASLAAIIGCDVRSAERYLAGDRTADAEAVLKILCSDYGGRMVEAAIMGLPFEEQQKFWKEMAKAARRAELIAQRVLLEKELSEL